MKKRSKFIFIMSVALILALSVLVGCNGRDGEETRGGEPLEYTLTFVADGADAVAPIKAAAGTAITPPANPQKDGFIFYGWYETSDFSGDSVTVPSVMPERNVTYYAKFVPVSAQSGIIYVYNLFGVAHSGEVTNSNGAPDETVIVKDGNDYGASGYKFVGWTDTPKGTVTLNQQKNPGQYNAGESVKLRDTALILYAQWAREYTVVRVKTDFKLYVYEPLIGKGLGAAILVRDGQPDKLGFVQAAEEYADYAEFTFYYESGDIEGRLYSDYTYSVPDGVEGQYLYKDYVTGEYTNYIFTADGYGFAVYIEVVGSQTAVRASGLYEYDEEYGDYEFLYVLASSEDNEIYKAYLTIEKTEINAGGGTDNDFDGYFAFLGNESGRFIEYRNGELDEDYYLELSGYGDARLYEYDYVKGDFVLAAEGGYRGTEYYESEYGEWEFVSYTSGVENFKFILGTANGYPIYIIFSEDLYGEFHNGNDELYLDGYGDAIYSSAGVTYVGECMLIGSTVTFVPYNFGSDGSINAGSKMYFNINREDNTFYLNVEGLVYEDDGNTTVISYVGESQIIEIPEGVTAVGDDAFSVSKNENGVSLVSVTLPSTLTSIGARAFENTYTLNRVIFKSTTPIQIDWSSANNPFRWPGGSFIIVVPEDCVQAYKNAWQDCPYTIMGSEEVTKLPEFETAEGVLVRYNKQPDSGDELYITLPDEVTEIADGVFYGMSYIYGVDLNNVIKVGASAFEGCENLVSVNFGSAEEIGEYAFFGCYNLFTSFGADSDDYTLQLPQIKVLGDYAFGGCISLRVVRLGENLRSIGAYAFYECNIYQSDPPLIVELFGTTPPTMGEHITTGNIAFRFKVQNTDYAIKCFTSATWKSYCRHLFIESGDEKGSYVCGLDILELDGRAMFQSATLMMYKVDGNNITFYEHDGNVSYYVYTGVITADGIEVSFYGVNYSFVPLTEQMRYVTADGDYTLILNPADFISATYANATLNGNEVRVTLKTYGVLAVSGYTDSDGKQYNLELTFTGNTLEVTKKPLDYIRDITCDDGSVINLHFSGSLTYIFGELKIAVGTNADGTDVYLKLSDYSVIAFSEGENVYTFTYNHASGKYNVTVTLSEDCTTFTYTYTKQ